MTQELFCPFFAAELDDEEDPDDDDDPFDEEEPVDDNVLESQPIVIIEPRRHGECRSRPFPLGELPAQSPKLGQGGIAEGARTEPCTRVPWPCATPSPLLRLSGACADEQRWQKLLWLLSYRGVCREDFPRSFAGCCTEAQFPSQA